MDTNKFSEYLISRYEGQINWYSFHASLNKRFYQCIQFGVIVLSAAVPVLVATVPADQQWLTITVAIILAVGTASLKTFKFQENWINYRIVSERLKQEKHFFDFGLNGYANAEDREALLIEKVESIIASEYSMWVTVQKQNNKEDKKG